MIPAGTNTRSRHLKNANVGLSPIIDSFAMPLLADSPSHIISPVGLIRTMRTTGILKQ
jgi:hypothetical protein